MEHAGITATLRIPGTYLAAIPKDIVNIIARLLAFNPINIVLDTATHPICDGKAKTVLASYITEGSVVTYDHRYLAKTDRQLLTLAGTYCGTKGIEVPGGSVNWYGRGIVIDTPDNESIYSECPFTQWSQLPLLGYTEYDGTIEPSGYRLPGYVITAAPVDANTYAYVCSIDGTTEFRVVLLETARGEPIAELSVDSCEPNLDCLTKCGDNWLLCSFIKTAKLTYITMSLHDAKGICISQAHIRKSGLIPYRILATSNPLCAMALYREAHIENHHYSAHSPIADTWIKAGTIKLNMIQNAKFTLSTPNGRI